MIEEMNKEEMNERAEKIFQSRVGSLGVNPELIVQTAQEDNSDLLSEEARNLKIESIAKMISKWKPNDIKTFLENLRYEINQVYPNYEAGYAETFLGKAAWEISKIK